MVRTDRSSSRLRGAARHPVRRSLGAVAAWIRASASRAAAFAAPAGRLWAALRPAQQLVVGFVAYALIGALVLGLPLSRTSNDGGFIDHMFNSVSAVSTTGLTTISVADSYSWLGQATLLVLFQIGGVGFMTISSVIIIARGRPLTESRLGVLHTGFALPHYFRMRDFLRHVIVFTGLCESLGAMLLWWRFHTLGVEDALWSAVFHAVSAFATAGFSLNSASLEAFAGDWVVNAVIGTLCLLGGVGFIVAQDVWYSIKLRERMMTFTSKAILLMTASILVLGTALVATIEPTVAALPLSDRLLASVFQVMTASTTAGFNTVPIGVLSAPTLVLIIIIMLIGASPSGTGGGMKTTTVSAILGNVASVLRGRASVFWLGHEIPPARVAQAFAAASLYLLGIAAGVLALTLTEKLPFIAIVFEACSAIGTVGLSTGVTGELTESGKAVIIALMLVGRCGPLTIGLSLLKPRPEPSAPRPDDLAV